MVYFDVKISVTFFHRSQELFAYSQTANESIKIKRNTGPYIQCLSVALIFRRMPVAHIHPVSTKEEKVLAQSEIGSV